MMNALVVCEGQTEEAFVKRILGPKLATENVFVAPRLIPTSRQSKGGALGGQRVLRFLRNTLLEREDAYVTTFFDLHGIIPGFPGRPGDDAILEAFRRLVRPEGVALETRNGSFHRMLVDGVTAEYRTGDGEIRGAQMRVIEELVLLAREMREAAARGDKLGLTEDELDGYPPDKQKRATRIVLEQAQVCLRAGRFETTSRLRARNDGQNLSSPQLNNWNALVRSCHMRIALWLETIG